VPALFHVARRHVARGERKYLARAHGPGRLSDISWPLWRGRGVAKKISEAGPHLPVRKRG
jgi:hypothetical protein